MRAHFCLIDGRVLLGVFRGVAFGGAGVQALPFGVYAGVCFFFGGKVNMQSRCSLRTTLRNGSMANAGSCAWDDCIWHLVCNWRDFLACGFGGEGLPLFGVGEKGSQRKALAILVLHIPAQSTW